MLYKILIITLVVLAGGGIIWSTVNFIKGNKNKSEIITQVDKNEKNLTKAIKAELADKCKTPAGYTDESWREHMSHHPDRYKECFEIINKKVVSNYHDISADELASMLKTKDFTLIDVHIPKQVHILGTDGFIPYNEIITRQLELPQDKNAKIVLYCRSGSMSSRAAKNLVKLGYTNVYNLIGGVDSWQQQGYEMENK